MQAQEAGLKASKQPMSGILKDYPNDAVIGEGENSVLVECKVRAVSMNAKGEKQFSFDLEWLKGVMRHAKQHNFRLGCVVFAPKSSQDKYVVLAYSDFLDLLSSTERET